MFAAISKVPAIILAAGEAKRMKSYKTKVLHNLCGKALVEWVLFNLEQAGIERKVVVVGRDSELVMDVLGESVEYAVQEERRGTAHALLQALEKLKTYSGTIFVIFGSMPLISADTIQCMLLSHEEHKNAATCITNGGAYCFDKDSLIEAFKKISEKCKKEGSRSKFDDMFSDENDKELAEPQDPLCSINTMLNALSTMGYRTEAITDINPDEDINITDRIRLGWANDVVRRHIMRFLMQNGVTIVDPATTYIDAQVKVGTDTQIYPGTIIRGDTVIGDQCSIGPGTRITSSTIGNYVEVENSIIIESNVEDGSHVGPFAYIRPESSIGQNVKIGDFVEIKKSRIGNDTKISHLTYVGDAEVGSNVNIGCGTVFVNYNGKVKSKTIVGDNAFIGCNTNLIAPVEVKNDSYIAAGSTITDTVPENSLAIARQRQIIKEDWVNKKNMKRVPKKGEGK